MNVQLGQVERRSLTVELSNGMRLTIHDGAAPSITVSQESRDLLNGAPSAPDVERYLPGGAYEIALPDVSDIGERCSGRATGDYDQPGTATIEVVHRH